MQVFPVGTRQPGIAQATKAIPAGAAGHNYQIQTTIAQVDLDDPTVVFNLSCYIQRDDLSYPNNASTAIGFQGGPNRGKGGTVTPAPGWFQPGSEVAGRNVRFVLEVTGRVFDAGLDANAL